LAHFHIVSIPYRYRFDSKELLDEWIAIWHNTVLKMNWHIFASTILGALFTFSGILFTHMLNLQRQKRADKQLIKALMQGLQDEINGLLEFAKVSSVHQIEAAPEGKPYEGLFTASQDYFTVYHANAALVMQINDGSLRRSIIQTYTRAKWLLDTLKMNRLYLERFHYLQSTFVKTREQSVQAEAEEYHQTLIAMAGQVKRAQAEFKSAANGLLSMLSACIQAT
jgi:hypothetical protein